MKSLRALALFALTLLLLWLMARTIAFGYLPAAQHKAISVSIEYRGSDAETMERLISSPMEREISRLAGIRELHSVSERNRTRIYVRFGADTALDDAYLHVRELVDRVYADLPEAVQRPVLAKSDLESRPVFIAAFEYASGLSEDRIKSAFENVAGVGEIVLGGAPRPEIRIRFDADRAGAAGITPERLVTALRGANVIGGFSAGTGIPNLLESRFRNLEELASFELAPGISLGEVAEVQYARTAGDSIGKLNGTERILVYIHAAGDANTIRLCRSLRSVTGSLSGEELLNSGAAMEEALRQIFVDLLFGIACVSLLTFLFLKRLAPAVLISLNIPFAVLFSAACLNLAGYQLDVMTLSGIAIGVGMVTDGGSIFAEEFFARGGDAKGALRSTMAPILSSSITALSVFLPLAFAVKELRDQFGGLAVAVTGSLASSLLYVFGFLPFLLAAAVRRPIVVPRLSSPGFLHRSLHGAYSFVARRRIGFACIMAVCLAMATAGLLAARRQTPPAGEADALAFRVEFASGTSLEAVASRVEELERELSRQSGIRRRASRYERERAFFDLQLDPKVDKDSIARRLHSLEPAEAFMYFPEESRDEESFEVVLTGEENRRLRELAAAAAGEIRREAFPVDVVFHFKDDPPSRYLAIDPQSASSAGIPPLEVYADLFWFLSGAVAAKWQPPAGSASGTEYADIRLSVPDPVSASEAGLKQWKLHSRARSTIELRDLAVLQDSREMGRIYHYDRQRSASFSVRTQRALKPKLLVRTREILGRFPFPPGYRARAGASEQDQARLIRSAASSLLLSVALILLILVFQFEHLKMPLFILAQIPLSFVLPLALLPILHVGLSLPVMMGLILSAGLSVNNAILVLDQIGPGARGPAVLAALQRKGKAMLIASLTTVMGVLPLLFPGKAGVGVLAPLACIIAVGVAGSIVFLLVTLPLAFPPPPPASRGA